TPHENKETMFELPRYVIKSGRILAEEGDIREEYFGKTLHVAPEYDPAAEQHIGEWFEQFYSIRFRNYPVGREYLHEAEQVACGEYVVIRRREPYCTARIECCAYY